LRRWFLSVGNHEVWGDPKIEGTLAAVPYLKNFGVTPERLIWLSPMKSTVPPNCRYAAIGLVHGRDDAGLT
jgi:hypothetical protein